MKKIGFLHTSPVHIATFDRLFQDNRENIELIHLVDEPLLAEAMLMGVTAEVETQVEGYITQLVAAGCDQVVCSCSTIGGVAEAIKIENVSISRIDRPMAATAVKNSHHILMVAAINSTLAPTRDLLLSESERQGRPVQIQELVLPDSWAEFLAGDLARYYEQIANGIISYLQSKNSRDANLQPQIIVFAQASMAPAAALLLDINAPILTSPELCVQHLLANLDS